MRIAADEWERQEEIALSKKGEEPWTGNSIVRSTEEVRSLKILVTGGAGFIGNHLTLHLLGEGHEVMVWDSINETLYPDSGRLSRVRGLVELGLQFYQQDASELMLEHLQGVDAIVNLSAIPGLEPSWRNVGAYFRENAILVQHLAALASEAGVHFIQISTSSVYGAIASPGAELRPNSPYGVSKLAGEHTVRAFASEKGLRFSILRLFSVYGPNQRPDQFLGKIVRLLEQNQPIPITGDGSQSRSYTYVADVVEAISLALKSGPLNDVVDICGSEEKTIIEIVELISRITGKNPRLEFLPSRLGDQSKTLGNLARTTEVLSWAPKTAMSQGLERMAASALSEIAGS